jgi:transmembrane sensor
MCIVIDEQHDIADQAVAWYLRQSGMTEQEWHGFILWIEADPAHAQAFDRVALDDRMLAEALTARHASVPTTPANDRQPSAPPTRRRWIWGVGGTAVAATIVAVLAPLAMPATSSAYAVVTKPGQRQNVVLGDGTRIEVSGGTRLQLDHDNPRIATLDSGEATFHVRHDALDPFTLHSGALTVQDLGTVFNVARNGAQFDVQVAEGAVRFQPTREALTLKPGNALTAREDLNKVALSQVAVDTVGGWRSGHLAFADEPLSGVVASIRRLYGTDLVLDPALSARPFTGMIRLSGLADQDVPHFAALVGARWKHEGERWTLSPASPDTP